MDPETYSSSASSHDIPADDSKSGVDGTDSSTTEKAASNRGKGTTNDSVVAESTGHTVTRSFPNDQDNDARVANETLVVGEPVVGAHPVENATMEESRACGEETMPTPASSDTPDEKVKAPDSVGVSYSERQPEEPYQISPRDGETRSNMPDGIGTLAETSPEKRRVSAASTTSHDVREEQHEDITSGTTPETGIPHLNIDKDTEMILDATNEPPLSSHIVSMEESDSSIAHVNRLERASICIIDTVDFRNDAAGGEREKATVAPVRKGANEAAITAGVGQLCQQQQSLHDPGYGLSPTILPRSSSSSDIISAEQRTICVQQDINLDDRPIGDENTEAPPAEDGAAATCRACKSPNPIISSMHSASEGVGSVNTENSDASNRRSPFTTAAAITANSASTAKRPTGAKSQSKSNGLIQLQTSSLRTARSSLDAKSSRLKVDNISEAMWRGQPVNIRDTPCVTLYRNRGKLIAMQREGIDCVLAQQKHEKMHTRGQPCPKSEHKKTIFRGGSSGDCNGACRTHTFDEIVQRSIAAADDGSSDNKKVNDDGSRCHQWQYSIDLNSDSRERRGREIVRSVLAGREPHGESKAGESKQEALHSAESETKSLESSLGIPFNSVGCTRRHGDSIIVATANRLRYQTRPEVFLANPYLGPPVAADFLRTWPDRETFITITDSSISGAEGAESCRQRRRHANGNRRKSRGDCRRRGVKRIAHSTSESKGGNGSNSSENTSTSDSSNSSEDWKEVYESRGSKTMSEIQKTLTKRRPRSTKSHRK